MVAPQLDLFGPSVVEARDQIEALRDAGVYCPCCDQWAKRYRRKLNSTMARSLIWIVRKVWPLQGGKAMRWVHVPTEAPKDIVRTNQLPTLAHWNLIESKANDDDSTRASGLWRPTLLGVDFVHRRRHVAEAVYLYAGKLDCYSDELTTIEAALGSRFDYAELMKQTTEGKSDES